MGNPSADLGAVEEHWEGPAHAAAAAFGNRIEDVALVLR
jgi:hypothetical protein